MSSTMERALPPKLAFLPPEDMGSGTLIHDVEWDRPGAPGSMFGVARFTVDVGCTSPVDNHLSHELWLVAEGEGELTYDGQSLRIGPGDIVHFQPSRDHQIRNLGDRPILAFSVWWRV
ncbi:MAG TPA: cupin domain-containing protein [Longimicrobiaceae bacterium]|nr:cupin domain-containing protein [Longimicrobiaceae bacterium]